MSQKLSVNNQCNKDFKKKKKTIMNKIMNDIFLKLMFNMLKRYMTFTMIYGFLPQRMKIEKVEKLLANLHDKN